MKRASKNLRDTKRAAEDLVSSLAGGKRPSAATIIGLSGDLGAGKTTFAQFVASRLGAKGKVTSPTFILMRRYPLAAPPFQTLYHIDAYRLKSGAELARLGFRALAADAGNLILIEWPEHVEEILPPGYQRVRFAFSGEAAREIEF